MIPAILKYKLGITVVLAMIVILRFLYLWQPQRQVELHQRHFLMAAQDRQWGKFDSFFGDDFRTPAGQDRAWALQQSHEVLRQFIALEIRTSNPQSTITGDTAHVSNVLHIEGSGTQLAGMAKSAVNQSTAPFAFTWKRKSWKPWDWQLISVDHPLLHITGDMME